MPYKSEKIRLPEHLDRRRKLTDADRADIKRRYKAGEGSTRKLAQEYGVCRKTIQIIVNPELKVRNDQYIKEHWSKYVPSKEEHARVIREHRRYKQELYLKQEIG